MVLHFSGCEARQSADDRLTLKVRDGCAFNKQICGSRTCKPNSVRRIAPAGRSFLWAAHYCAAQATYPEVVAHRAGTRLGRTSRLPPYLVLLRVGFALPAALLRRRCALTAPFHPYLDVATAAVCFLWHFPSTGLEPGLPDVIRHTALRSSDFPPVLRRATVRSGCQRIIIADVGCQYLVAESLDFGLGPRSDFRFRSTSLGPRIGPHPASSRLLRPWCGQRPTTNGQRLFQFGKFLSSF